MQDFHVDFIGIGAAKSGSTWLANVLSQHPEICFSSQKEVNFFNARGWGKYENKSYNRGLSYYRSFWPKSIPERAVVGEFSPIYLYDAKAPARIRKKFPETKLLVILRNPAGMIYSRYWYNVNFHLSIPREVSFEQALKKYAWLLKCGLFSEQLKRYYALFQKKQIKVILLDDVKKNPRKVAREVYGFVGVDKNFTPDMRPQNVSKRTKSPAVRNVIKRVFELPMKVAHAVLPRTTRRGLARSRLAKAYLKTKEKLMLINTRTVKNPEMHEETRKKLVLYFRKDVKKLEKIIGRDLGSWKREA